MTAFDRAFALSKGNMANIDFGHYVAAGNVGGTPMQFLEKFHDRIASFHLKDRTTPEHCSLNLAWGTGDTPIKEILQLVKKNKWKMPASIELQWILYSTPQNPDDPGLDTWASLEAARHGAGATWIPGSYDPDTHLYIYGTGNPTPAYTQGRGDGDNLFTSCLIAVNVDTGRMAWYFQTSPHDTHDWDSTQTPILVDAPFNGRLRKLVMTATRNGYFFVLDRTTGEHLVTSKLGLVNNWALGLDANGQPKRNPDKDATIAGSLVNGDVTNYPPPTFSPDTRLFYVHEQNSLRISYLMEPDPRGSMGLGGTTGGGNLSWGTFLVAVDYKTGRIQWRKELNGGSAGLLSTAGGLLFLSNGQNAEAWDAATGKGLWYSQIGGLSAPPETFLLDGHQHLLFSAGGGLYLFVLN
jgi:alcohol dehydrogenase (cytochrome c)